MTHQTPDLPTIRAHNARQTRAVIRLSRGEVHMLKLIREGQDVCPDVDFTSYGAWALTSSAVWPLVLALPDGLCAVRTSLDGRHFARLTPVADTLLEWLI